MADNFFKISKGVNYSPQASAPSNPSNGDIYYNSTDEKFKKYEDGFWSNLGDGAGSSSGINYSTNPDAEVDISGWDHYKDAAASTPVDGTGGSPGSGFIRTTILPLRGSGSFLLTNSGANRQGEGASSDFTIDRADEGKNLRISFDHNTDSNYVNGDVRMFVYDVTNATLINVVTDNDGDIFQNSGLSDTFTGSFQSSSTSTSYRLIYHITSTNANNWNLRFDNVKIGPDVLTPGSIITEWESFTPTWEGASVNPSIGNGTITGRHRRVGDSMEVSIDVLVGSTTTTGTGVWKFVLPNGESMDTSKLPGTSTHVTILGTGQALDFGNNYREANVIYNGTTGVRVTTNSNNDSWQSNFPYTWTTNDQFGITFKVPIEGWSAGAMLSTTEASLQTVKAIIPQGSGFNHTSSGSILKITGMAAATKDTSGSWDSTNSKFVVPMSGDYDVSYELPTGAVGNTKLAKVYVNGAPQEFCRANSSTAAYATLSGCGTIPDLKKGDYLEFYYQQFTGGSETVSIRNISIARKPDFSTFSVYGEFELESATSSVKTPTASAQYHQMTGNSLTLKPGTYKLMPSLLEFTKSGSAQYTRVIGTWYAANGADSGTVPAHLSTATGLTILSATSTFAGRIDQTFPVSNDRDVYSGEVIVRTTEEVTIYLVPWSQMTTAANARITVYPNAQRIQ